MFNTSDAANSVISQAGAVGARLGNKVGQSQKQCAAGLIQFDSIEDAIKDIQDGKFVIVADDEGRENEGDLICAAELITPEMINFMISEARGWVCLAMTEERCEQLSLP